MEVLPIRSEIYIPEYKRSAWVYTKGVAIVKDKSKEHQGAWVVDGYTLDKKKAAVEVWIFDDDVEIDRRVLENNPLQGNWGYAPSVKEPSKAEPKDMWFYPPKSAKAKTPPEFESYKHMGTWVKPTFKRDFSALGSNSSGFMTVSGEMKVAKGEKHSVTGRWNMMGFNDDVVRGKSKKPKTDIGGDSKWQIYVRKVNGERFPIQTIPGNKISQCKVKIEAKKKIPVADQRLSFNGEPLKDEKTLNGSGIRNGDTIDLLPMIVYVRTRKGKKHTFELDQDELVEDFKPRVEKREGTPVAKQRLSHKNWKLVDGKPLNHFKVRHKSIIDLGGMEIYVQPLGDAPRILVEVDPTNNLKSVKTKVKNRIDMPVAEQRLQFEEKEMMDDGKDLASYGVQHLDTLFMLKDKPLKESTRPPSKKAVAPVNVQSNKIPNKQKKIPAKPVKQPQINFKGEKPSQAVSAGKVPEPKVSKRAIDSNGSEPVHQVPGKPFPQPKAPPKPSVNIKAPDGNTYPVPFDPTKDTVKDIRRKAGKKAGIPLREVQLVPQDEDDPIGDDTKPKDGMVLEIPPSISVELPDKSKVKLVVLPKMTVGDLKEELEEKVGKPAKQRVFFMDVEDSLPDDILLSKAGIPLEGHVLKVGVEPDTIEVEHPDGRSFFMDLDDEPSRPELEKRAAAVTGLPLKNIKFVVDNDEIGDDYIPSDGDVLTIAPLISIEMPDKSKVELVVLPKMTVGDLKDELEEKVGGPINHRVFFLDADNDLPDDAVVSKAGIGNGALLQVQPKSIDVTISVPDKNGPRIFHMDLDPKMAVGDFQKHVARLAGVPLKNVKFDHHGDDNDVQETKDRIFFMDAADPDSMDSAMPISKAGVVNGTVLELSLPEPEEITVRAPDGRTFIFTIDPDIDSAEDMRRKVASVLNVPFEQLPPLAIDGSQIDDTYKPSKGDIFDLLINPIIVELPDESHVTLSILPCQTFGEIKDMIEEQSGMDKAKMRTFFFDNAHGSEMDDGTPVSLARFKSGVCLKVLSVDDEMEMPVKDSSGRTFVFSIHPEEPMQSVKKRMREKIGFGNVGVFKLGDKTWDDEDDDIVFKDTGLPIRSGGILCVEPPGSDFDELPSKKVGLSVLPKASMADVEEAKSEPMRVRVSISGKKKPIPFKVSEGDLVKQLRQRATKKAEFVGDQCLMLGGQQLDDSNTLLQSNVQHDDLLVLESFMVNVMDWDGYAFTIRDLNLSDTIRSLKKKIQVEREIDSVDHVKLVLGGRRLAVDEHNLAQEKIPHRAALVLEPPFDVALDLPDAKKKALKARRVKKFKGREEDIIVPVEPDYKKRHFIFDSEENFDAHIEVKVIDARTGKTHTLSGLLLTEKVIAIKNRLFDTLGMAKKKQRLRFRGNLLDVKKSLLVQGLHHKAIVTMEIPQKNVIATPDLERVAFGTSRTLLPTKLAQEIRITVQDWRGQTHQLIGIAVTEYPDDVRDRIEALTNIPVDQQRLTFNGRLLDDTLNLVEQHVGDGTMLKLEPMRVFVQLPSKKDPVGIKVELSDTVTKLKKKITKANTEMKDTLCLMLGGEELADSKTLGQLGIQHEDLLMGEHYKLSVMHWLGDKFELTGIRLNDTIHDVKDKIQMIHFIPRTHQTLTLQGQPLNDLVSLQSQGITHRSVLVLEEATKPSNSPVKEKMSFRFLHGVLDKGGQPTKVSLDLKIKHWKGQIFSVQALPSEYTEDVKEKLALVAGLSVDQQRLAVGGRPMEDGATLEQQNVNPDNATLELLPMTVYVQIPNGNRVAAQVDSDHTVHQLKKLVAKSLKANIVNGNCIVVAGKELMASQKLSECEVEHGDVLHLEPYALSIMDSTGTAFRLEGIRPKDNVEVLKGMIMERTSIPRPTQVLRLNGQLLKDLLSLEDQKVRHRSVLTLEKAIQTSRSPVKGKVSLVVSSALPLPAVTENEENDIEDDISCDASPVSVASLSSSSPQGKMKKSIASSKKLKRTTGKAKPAGANEIKPKKPNKAKMKVQKGKKGKALKL